MENIRASYGNTAGLVARAASFTEDSGLELTLKNFLDYYHLDPRAIYKLSSFSRICARADTIEDFSEPMEDILTKAFAKLAVIDSRRWISFLLDVHDTRAGNPGKMPRLLLWKHRRGSPLRCGKLPAVAVQNGRRN